MAGGKLVVHFVGRRRPARRPRRCAASQLLVAAADRPPLEDPDEFYDTDLVGLAARTVDGAELGPVRDVLHAGRRRLPGAARSTAASGSSRSSPRSCPTVDVAGGTRRRRPARRAVRPVSAAPDARRRHDLPRLPRAAAPVAARQGDRARPGRARACTTCGAGPTTSHRTVDDTPYGGGPGHGDAARAVGAGAGRARRRPARPQPRLIVPTPGRAARSPRPPPRAWPPSRGCCSPAAATRASTRGWSTTPRSGCRSRRSRSATTCWPAARPRCWSSSRRSVRLLPGVLGNERSAVDDSFAAGRARRCSRRRCTPSPASWRGLDVPAGAAVGQPRRDRALAGRAAAANARPQRRPDLL